MRSLVSSTRRLTYAAVLRAASRRRFELGEKEEARLAPGLNSTQEAHVND